VALLRCAEPGQADAATSVLDQTAKASSSNATAIRRHQDMPGDDHPGAVVLLEAAHRPQARLQPAVVTLDAVIGVPVGAVPRRWPQLLQHHRVHRRLIGSDLDRRDLGHADGPLEEPAGGLGVAPWGDEHITEGVPARPSGIGQERWERSTHRWIVTWSTSTPAPGE
jgi:hypothetical protein